MPRLIIKNSYLKGGTNNAAHLSNLVKYIATRDGVEIVYRNPNAKATTKQKDLIEQILRDFPNVKNSFEYEDYVANPTVENASDFITIALEQSMNRIAKKENYVGYIAHRPNVEKLHNHGLFTSGDEKINLAQVAEEVANHEGNVWIPIISLRREDAVAVGYDNAERWKNMLESYVPTIADGMKIPIDKFKWYAAFHNESHHPHVHMICYSTDTKYGYLNQDGIYKIKSGMVKEIFKEQLLEIYQRQTKSRDKLKAESEKMLRDLKAKILQGDYSNPRLEELITTLNHRLKFVSGKKQYGYLKPHLKAIINEIVDELAKEPSIKTVYDLWCELQTEVYRSYQDTEPQPLPLSQQKEFKSIKNMVIQEVLNLDTEQELTEELTTDEEMTADEEPHTQAEEIFEEEPVLQADEIAEPSHSNRKPQKSKDGYHLSWSQEYKSAKKYLHGDDETESDFAKAMELLTQESEGKNALAMFDIARMYADGLGVEIDNDKAHELYTRALFAFEQIESEKPWKYIEYRIGKIYAQGLGTEQDYKVAAHWFTLSANEKYKYAEYSLGGLYYRGQGVEQDYKKAFELYLRSASQGFPYAQYEVAKMYRDNIGIEKNTAESDAWFAKAFIGFEGLEQQSHDDKLQYRLGAMLQKGIGTEVDIPRAKKYFEMSAKVGNSFACYSLAKMILEDEASTAEEIQTAITYLQTAADGGNQFAQYSLGKIYLEEKYVGKDVAKALELLHLSAEQGNQFANYKLGKLYLGTDDIPKDITKAIHHLTLSAEQKNQFAEYALGSLYLRGEDVPKDITKALEYLHQAADQGNEFAKYRLGILYLKGEDVPKDIERAIRYLTEVAEDGNQFAQYQLGKLYLLGKDVDRDKDTAVKWLTLSAEQGNEYAKFFLDNMDKRSNPSVGMCASRLLGSLGRLFADKAVQDSTTTHKRIDSKQLRKLREKKLALGQKIGVQEEENLEQRLQM